MNKKKIMWIIGFVILVLLVLLVIFFINKKDAKNLDKITSFRYYSGSSGYAIELNGTVEDEFVNISIKEYDGGDQNLNKVIIPFSDLKKILNNSKEEDCKKHTYEYQCGDSIGCSVSTLSVSFEKDKDVCYKITTEISDFFNNLG